MASINLFIPVSYTFHYTTVLSHLYRFTKPSLYHSQMETSDTSASKRQRPPSFRVEVPGDETFKKSFHEKIQKVRAVLVTKLQRPVSNADILGVALDTWLEQCGGDNKRAQSHHASSSASAPLQEKDRDQDVYLIAESSLNKLIVRVQEHARHCKESLRVSKINRRGHVAVAKLKCAKHNTHCSLWSSSPQLPNGKYLINERVNHGVVCSGMLPVHYRRFSDGAGIGKITDQQQRDHFAAYKDALSEEYKDSTQRAMEHEIASYDIDDNWQGINIMTDARHGWRKNAKDSSIVCIGEKSHAVLQHVHITKKDDHVSQRHEKVGTEKVYEYLSDQGVSAAVHTHDRNMSINKYIREQQKPTTGQNDTWHSEKSLKKAVAQIGVGPKYKRGKTWHPQLEDKSEPVATHAHWSMHHCGGDPEVLRKSLLNIIDHYKDIHTNCHSISRCRTDPNYEPSRQVITDPAAEALLRTAITKSVLYSHAEDYVLAKDTFLVESFNNTMNIFHDKRIAFGDDQYLNRSQLATCHWNENVDREHTSIWQPKHDPKAPRRRKGKKILKRCTYNYRRNVWKRYIHKVYQQYSQ